MLLTECGVGMPSRGGGHGTRAEKRPRSKATRAARGKRGGGITYLHDHKKGKCIDVRETDRIQASTLFSISESNHLIGTILGQAQSGIPTFAESKFIHATELINHARTGPSPLARPPARARQGLIHPALQSPFHGDQLDGRTDGRWPLGRRRHKLTPTATAALLARSPSPSLSPSSARQSNPILPERVSGQQTDRPTAAVRGADFFFHRSLRGKGRRGDER